MADVSGMYKECLNCGKKIKIYPSRAKAGKGKFCSRICRGLSERGKIGHFRGKSHSVQSNIKNRLAHLGKKNKNKHMNFKNCEICEKIMCIPNCLLNKKRSCSRECQKKWQSINRSGENSPSWVDGRSKVGQRLRTSPEYTRWRMNVLERDNYTCQICFKRGGLLEADHIKSFALFPELRLVLSNGRTLCKKCHRLTPTWGVQKKEDKYGSINA